MTTNSYPKEFYRWRKPSKSQQKLLCYMKKNQVPTTGYDLSNATNISTSTLYGIFPILDDYKLVASKIDSTGVHKKRYYALNDLGLQYAEYVIEEIIGFEEFEKNEQTQQVTIYEKLRYTLLFFKNNNSFKKFAF